MTDPFLAQAKALISKGQKAEARRLLHDYVALYSNNIEAWLLLAALSSPRASLEYVHKALAIDPDSPVAQKALNWAAGRLNKYKLELPAVAEANPEPKPAALSEVAPPLESGPHLEPVTLKARRHTSRATRPHIVAQSAPSRPKSISLVSLISIISFAAACLITGFIIVNNTRASDGIPRYVAQIGDLEKATLTHTPTFTATFTPTETYTPTATNTPTETPTPVPTDTPTPTATFTFTPTFTATNTPLPTNTLPPPTAAPPTATLAAAAPVVSGTTGRWIEINLTNQTLTAWEGDVAVNTFPVSSGKWSTQTLPGTFHVYIKLRVTRMYGFDYDTPDVPYVMYYDGDFAIHGAYWHNNFGVPVSHGCVNLPVPASAWLFDWASVGTMVKIHY